MILAHPTKDCRPVIPASVFVAPTADVIGEVTIGEHSSIWFQVVVRGDVNWIKIGARTNIQDQSCLHVTRRKSPLTIGDEVTVGHRVMLHGCTLGSRILVGMGSIIMDDAVIGDDCIIGAGALVTQRTVVPAGHLVMGSPAKVVRPLKQEELDYLKKSAQNYVNDSAEYMNFLKTKELLK